MALDNLDELAGFGPRIAAALAPHSIYTVSEGLLRWTAEQAGERRLPVHIHLSETKQEVEDCLAEHGVRPAIYLDRLGVLNERTILAHGVWLDEEELALIAARACTVVTNPVANMKLAVGGVFPYPAAREAGVAVGLGTDGAGSNDSLDLLADLKLFALAQRHASGDPTVVPAEEAWGVASGGARLQVGEPADFLLLRTASLELSLGDLYSDLVYAASGSIVDTTVVARRGADARRRGAGVRGGRRPGARALAAARDRRLARTCAGLFIYPLGVC
jgi:5-methylthioadenosine/S-adenosylhomocysteine deaminase